MAHFIFNSGRYRWQHCDGCDCRIKLLDNWQSLALFLGSKNGPAACFSMHELRACPLQELQPEWIQLFLRKQRVGCRTLFRGRGGRGGCDPVLLKPVNKKSRQAGDDPQGEA